MRLRAVHRLRYILRAFPFGFEQPHGCDFTFAIRVRVWTQRLPRLVFAFDKRVCISRCVTRSLVVSPVARRL